MKIGVFVVAYNAESSIAKVLMRIPEKTWDRLSEVFIFDDCSADTTAAASHKLKEQHPRRDKIRVFRNIVNLGYGGNQKRGYLYAIQNGFDIVVLLHGDGQYAPEVLDQLVDPLVKGEAEAVFGSRMLIPGDARKGGMPLYKYAGNKILTKFQNAVLGREMTEYHSGYRAYHVPSLAKLPFLKNSDDFHFDNEIIIQHFEAGLRIRETPIPTYYGDEICYVNGMKYAWDVFRTTLKYRLHKSGLLYCPQFDLAGAAKYTYKENRYSSHRRVLNAVKSLGELQGLRVLDVGCGSGALAARLAQMGCHVVGLDIHDSPEAQSACAEFFVCDLDQGLPLTPERRFDCIILADILEHVKVPEDLLERVDRHLAPGGNVIAVTGNVAHLYVRLMLLLGQFRYSERGILDRTHRRFFTRATFLKLFRDCGIKVLSQNFCPIPFEKVLGRPQWLHESLTAVSMFLAWLWPSLFAYQIVVHGRFDPAATGAILRYEQIHSPYHEWQEGSAASLANSTEVG